MIRYINLGNQISEDQQLFALFDTVTERFLSIADVEVFESRMDLGEALAVDRDYSQGDINRIFELIPKEQK